MFCFILVQQQTGGAMLLCCWIFHKINPSWLQDTVSCNLSLMKLMQYVRFQVFTAVTMKNVIFWDVTPCGSCKNWCFRGMYCLDHHGNTVIVLNNKALCHDNIWWSEASVLGGMGCQLHSVPTFLWRKHFQYLFYRGLAGARANLDAMERSISYLYC
jgi:hypothetical protein